MAKSSNRLSEILEKRRLKSEIKEDKVSGREDKKENKRNYKLEKIKEVTAKAYAVATKRKWLVFLIVAAIAAYLIIFKGGGASAGGGVLDIVKGFFN
jgi:hypothetical protein|tara:strand:- start:8644 stop:8934 length:291 start_codon:yes stop_codon:yes gene_type:complete